MKELNNEKGYALLLVLFLIVFITVITAVFITGSLSNAKQEQRVDENQLAVTAAEAGVDYYKTSLINKYVESQKELEQLANTEIARQQELINKKSQQSIDYDLVKQKVVTKLSSILKNEVNNFLNENNNSISKNYIFIFSEHTSEDLISLDGYNINLHAIVRGQHKTREKVFKDMDLDMLFTLKDFSSSAPPAIPANRIDINNLYPDDSLVPVCGSSKDLKNEKCKASRNIDYKQIKNHSIVYFPQGYVKASGDLDMKNDTFIYSKASNDYGTSGFYANKLVVKGYSIFTHIGSLRTTEFEVKNNTRFFINGSLDILADADFKNDSVIAIYGSGRFYKQLSIKNDTTVCVNGSITVDGNFEIKNNSKLYIYGTLNKQPTGGGQVVHVGPTEVFNYCSADSSVERVWPSPKVDASYR